MEESVGEKGNLSHGCCRWRDEWLAFTVDE